MKILAIYDDKHPSAVDQWRIIRPLQELAKHVDWQIDHIAELAPNGQTNDVVLQQALDKIRQYDIVYSTYQSNPHLYTLLQIARDKYGTQYIMDVDDDLFSVNPDNPVWLKADHKKMFYMQRMAADNAWLTTTTHILKDVLVKRRTGHSKNTVFVTPNCISDVYNHPPLQNDDIVIGYYGGSSHYNDLHSTHVLDAVAQIMHKYKNVRFKCVGVPVDTYLPKQRTQIVDAGSADKWLSEIYPSMHMDIALGPLANNLFNLAKSNIKWQEATRMGAVFVCSDIGPYAALSNKIACKVNNDTKSWYTVLETLVEDKQKRQNYVDAATKEIKNHYRLETQWQQYKTMFKTVYDVSRKPNMVLSK